MNMNMCPGSRHCYEFCFPNLDTLVQVEESNDTVVIRATRDTFSELRKTWFIRELAAEGFISDAYEWFSRVDQWSSLQVRSLVNYSWLKPDEAAAARTKRFMIRLILSAITLWLIMMGVLLRTSQ